MICTRQWLFLQQPRERQHPKWRSEGRNDHCCSSGNSTGGEKSDPAGAVTRADCSEPSLGSITVQAEEGIHCHGSREIRYGCVLEQDATGSAALGEPLRIQQRTGKHHSLCPSPLLLGTATGQCAASSSQERVLDAGLRLDEGEQNLGRTLAPAENALSEHWDDQRVTRQRSGLQGGASSHFIPYCFSPTNFYL